MDNFQSHDFLSSIGNGSGEMRCIITHTCIIKRLCDVEQTLKQLYSAESTNGYPACLSTYKPTCLPAYLHIYLPGLLSILKRKAKKMTDKQTDRERESDNEKTKREQYREQIIKSEPSSRRETVRGATGGSVVPRSRSSSCYPWLHRYN